MPVANPLANAVKHIERLPNSLKYPLLTWIFNRTVKFAGTARLQVIELTETSVTFRQRNKKRVQNHIGGVHAAAMALLAESATGFITGLKLPGDKLPLLKSMQVNYLRRAQGELTAKAWLTPEQLTQLQQDEKGDFVVAVTVTDAAGETPIECQMCWAWVPKKR